MMAFEHIHRVRIIFAAAVCFLVAAGSIIGQAKLPASPIKTVYIVPTSHYDLGFAEPPEAILDRAARHIDEVMRVAEADPNFRWTIESVWQIDAWLKRAKKPTSVLPKDKQKIARLMDLIKSGRVAVSMSWGSMHTDFMGQEELNRLIYDFTALKKTYGIDSKLAMLDDVPGHPTSLPNVIAGSGGKYLVTGANIFIGQATSLAPGRVPFYWESPDGSRVLTWVSQSRRGGYTEAMTDFYLDPYSLDPYTDRTPFDMFNPQLAGKKTPLEIMEIGAKELLDRYNKAGYKFDAVMAMYAHDFVEPTNVLNLAKAVRMWNAKHPELRLKIATPDEFLGYIESRYKPRLEVHRGEWSGLWSEAKTQSPKISALARYAHDHTPAGESLWSSVAIRRQIPFPVGNFTRLYRWMLTYDEHSGAGNTGWPQLNSSDLLEEQNRQYVDYLTRTRAGIDGLFDDGLRALVEPSRYDTPRVAEPNKRTVMVYNGLSFARNDVVRLAGPRVKIEKIRDAATGRQVEFDVEPDGDVTFVATDVPAFGYRAYEMTVSTGQQETTLRPRQGMSIANAKFEVEMRPDGNVKRIRDLASGRELVNDAGSLPFNALLRVEGSDASRVTYPMPARIFASEGKVMSRIIVARAGSAFPITTIKIYRGTDRVEISNELDPDQMAFAGGNKNWSDSYYFAFPLNVGTDGLKVIRGGQKWFDMLPDDHLPGARNDSVTTQHVLGMTDGRSTGLIAHRQAFHWVFPGFVSTRIRPKESPAEFPAMFTGKWPLPEATIYSRAVRRGFQADTHDIGVINMPSVEPGLGGRYIFDYAVRSSGTFDPVAARRLGAEFNVPLIARYLNLPPAAPLQGNFGVDKDNVEIVSVKPVTDNVIRGEVSASPLDPPVNKRFIVRLQEFAGRTGRVAVTVPARVRSASIVSMTEDRVIRSVPDVDPLRVDIRPFETLTVLFEIE